MAKLKTTEVKPEKKKISFMEVLTGIWMVAMIAVYPLFNLNKYKYLLEEKYGFMLAAGGILLAGFIIWALIAKRPKQYIAHMKSFADPKDGKWFGDWFRDAFNVWDIMVLAFLIIVIISTLCASPYVYQAFFGNEGRWTGALTLVMWCLIFFVVSRYFVYRRWYVDVFLIVGLFICIWAITDYFDMDILGYKYEMNPKYRLIFTSSIGNIDAFGGFSSIVMAIAGALFIVDDTSVVRRILYWICFTGVILSMITCGADNAYIAMVVFLAFMPIAAALTKAGIRRFIAVCATVATSIVAVCFVSTSYGHLIVRNGGTMTEIFERFAFMKWLAIILWAIAIALFIYEVVIKKYTDATPAPKLIRTIWIALLIVAASGLIVMVAIANSNPSALPASMDSIKHYLVLSDDWGTWRMYVWKKLLEIYSRLPFIHKLFGTGPDTAGIYLFNDYYYDIAMVTGQLFDSPHNEWLQMFFTMGPLGLIAYLSVFITPAVMAFRRSVKKYYAVVLGVGFVCICHLGVSFVSVMTPIDLATIFALMALAQSLFRSKE